MELITVGPFRVASFEWKPARGGGARTVVCKATFTLAPGELRPAPAVEPLFDRDRHHRDDPAASVAMPSDLVPFKPRADVLIVGHAYAPGGAPVTSLTPRIRIADVEKALEIAGDRAYLADGRPGEPAPFDRMPLVYERAGGGPGTANPVGIPAGAPHAPNLMPVGAKIADGHTPVEPIGFGPLASGWPSRAEKLGGAGRLPATWPHEPLPASLDPAFFNVAPRDQQAKAIRPDETISLRNLVANSPSFVATLPGLAPRGFLDVPGAPPVELSMVCDTLLIDTDRMLCTVTWRAQTLVDAARPAKRVVVVVQEAGTHVEWADAERMIADPSWRPAPDARRSTGRTRMDETAAAPVSRAEAALPFQAAQRVAAPVPVAPVIAPPVAPPPVAAPPAAVQPLPASPAAAPSRTAAASPWAAGAPSTATPTTGSIGAQLAGSAVAAPSVVAPTPQAPPRAPRAPSDIVHLLWSDDAVSARLRRNPNWRQILDELEEQAADSDLDGGDSEEEGEANANKRDVIEILTQDDPTEPARLIDALLGAVRADGKLVPPLVMTGGELEVTFDEVETLRATAMVAAPAGITDKPLKDLLDVVAQILAVPGIKAPAIEGLAQRVREAHAAARPKLAAGWLEPRVERTLLEGKSYDRREVLGAPHVRALLRGGDGGDVVAAYLPDALAKLLPLFPRFRARLLAEVHPTEDPSEASSVCLRVLALARLVPPPVARR